MSPRLRKRPVGAIPTVTEFRHQVSRENRLARYEAICTLHKQAFSMEAIARRLHISTYTVRRFLKAEAFPEITPPPYRGSILDPYKSYLLARGPGGLF
jgi:transposase